MGTFWSIVASNGLLVIVMAACLTLLGRIWKNPAVLHLLWLFVLLKFITPPMVTLTLWFPSIHAPPAAREPEPDRGREPDLRGEKAAVVEHAATGEHGEDGRKLEMQTADAFAKPGAELTPNAVPQQHLSWLAVASLVWAGGIMLWGACQAYRIRQFQRLLRVAQPASSSVNALTERAAGRLGLRRTPRVIMLPICVPPLVWSLGGRPTVVLPTELFNRLDAPAQEAILTHELAHVRRKDHWVRLLEMIVVTLFWWHPVAWWARWQLRTLEEPCCDAMAIGATTYDVRSYAMALLDTLEFLSQNPVSSPLGLTAAGPALFLARRIKMLRNPSSFARLTLGRIMLTVCLAAVPMVLAFAIEPVKTNEPSPPAADKSSGQSTPSMHGVDLSYVPSAAWALVAIRPAEMLKAAELPELKTLIEEKCGPTFGKLRLPVAKIAQITWVPVFRDIMQEAKSGNLVIYQMIEPYDFRELIRAELSNATKQDYQVQAGYVPKTGPTWSGFFPIIDGQEVWCDWYQQPAGLRGLKEIVDAYRKAGKTAAATTEAETKRKTVSYYVGADAAGTKQFVLVPDKQTIVFARSINALEEIFGSDEMVWRPYVEPGKDRAVLLVWGARRGGPRFLPAERRQWQTVRDDHLAVWAVRQPMELIKGWPGYPEFVDYGASPFAPVLKHVPTAIGLHLDGQMRIRAAIVARAESNRQFASSLEASLKLAAAMGEMYRGDVKLAEESVRAHYMKLIDDYLGLLKHVKVTADGDVLRADTTADVSALKNALSLLAAKYLPPQRGPTPKSDKAASDAGKLREFKNQKVFSKQE